jgi:ankyrin repeat protein
MTATPSQQPARTAPLWVLAAAAMLNLAPLACSSQGGANVLGRSAAEYFSTDPLARDLAVAAAAGKAAEVAGLVRRGANPNHAGNEGITPLHWAALAQSKPGMVALLKAGADPNRRSANGTSAVALVTGARDPELLAILLRHGANPSGPGRDGQPLVFQAIMQHDLNAVRLLAEHGADLNARGAGGQTPLMLAADVRQLDIARYLLDRGADWRLTDPDGSTFAVAIQGVRISPEFREKAAALQQIRDFLERNGVRFPVEEPWQRRDREARGGVAPAPTS